MALVVSLTIHLCMQSKQATRRQMNGTQISQPDVPKYYIGDKARIRCNLAIAMLHKRTHALAHTLEGITPYALLEFQTQYE